jgi:hypothetical protein
MTRKGLTVAASIVVLISSLGLVIARVANRKEVSPLRLNISTLYDVDYNVSHIPLKVTFENTSEGDVRILQAFKDPAVLPVFFRFGITASDGTPIATRGGGKVTLSPESYQYAVLKRGQKLEVIADVARVLPDGVKLKEGTYHFNLVYQNQYGADCFKGRVESNIIEVRLADTN